MMNRIRILPEEIVNKIAAGEVIERPASVVKELAENGLDAGAKALSIIVHEGGKGSIEIRDDGCGMSKEELLLSLERHATSKIHSVEDLSRVETYGFRGEALPSIAAVSRLEIFTRPEGALSGTYLRASGGRIEEVREVGCPIGTTVKVERLFYNVPARKKFLRSHATESSHIHDAVSRIAFARPEVGIRYLHGRRLLIDSPPCSSWEDRLADMLGKEISSQLYPVEAEEGLCSIMGFLSHPNLHKATAVGIYIFVNGRPVHDTLIRRALLDGYHPYVPNHRFPLAFCFLSVPSERLDVNVHPSKKEVRFREPGLIRSLVLKMVALVIKEQPWLGGSKSPSAPRIGDARKATAAPWSARFQGVREAHGASLWRLEKHPGASEPETGRFGPIQYLGQLAGTYLLFASPEGLLIIDQHAAHERVLYETLKSQRAPQGAGVQRSLIEQVIELPPHDSERLAELEAELAAAGIEIAPFGVNSWRIRSVPSWLAGIDVRQMIHELLEELASMDYSTAIEKRRERLDSILACHGAVRAARHMTTEEAYSLLEKLDQEGSIASCPHGRPAIIEIPLEEIEKRFRRR